MNIDEFINNFYGSRIIYILIILLLGIEIVNDLKNKDNLDIKNKLNFKKIDFNLLFKALFLSMFIRISIELLLDVLNIEQTSGINANNIYEYIMQFVYSCIFAPIFEEIIFRFGIYEKLNKKINYIISLLITSFIFSLIHFYKIDGFIILFIISAIWNYTYYKTNNLIYPIILHFAFNFYALFDITDTITKIVICTICIIGFYICSLKKQKK